VTLKILFSILLWIKKNISTRNHNCFTWYELLSSEVRWFINGILTDQKSNMAPMAAILKIMLYILQI